MNSAPGLPSLSRVEVVICRLLSKPVRGGQVSADIGVVISNRPNAGGLQTAAQAGLETLVLDHKRFPSREAFDAELARALHSAKIDLIILAGFMRILTADFVNQFQGRLVNIHPSLLPKYPGLNTHDRAIDNGDSVAGATVHYVTPDLDGGPPIVHVKCPIRPRRHRRIPRGPTTAHGTHDLSGRRTAPFD